MKYDVVALGELLIDFAPAGKSPVGMTMFEQNSGGAPANVLTAVVRQGGTGAFIGKVDDDAFRYFLKQTLDSCGIESHGLRFDRVARTTLAFVSLDERATARSAFIATPALILCRRNRSWTSS